MDYNPDPNALDYTGDSNTYDINQLPSFQIDPTQTRTGTPQAPWYQGAIDAGVNIAKSYVAIDQIDTLQRQGINYKGPAPWLNGTIATPGANGAPGTVQTGAANNQSLVMILLFVVVAAVALKG